MISNISIKITQRINQKGLILPSECELYSYGFFLLISNTLFMVITMIFGIICNVVWESVMFYILFSTLRSYAGGVHASKEVVCMGCTTLMLCLCIMSISLLQKTNNIWITIVLMISGGLVTFILSPLDSKEKPLLPSELKYYGRISKSIVGVLTVASLVLFMFKIYDFAYIVAITEFSEGVLLILGKVKKFSLNREK